MEPSAMKGGQQQGPHTMSSRMSSGSELRLRTAPSKLFQPACVQYTVSTYL